VSLLLVPAGLASLVALVMFADILERRVPAFVVRPTRPDRH
jgi:hypothetical protein